MQKLNLFQDPVIIIYILDALRQQVSYRLMNTNQRIQFSNKIGRQLQLQSIHHYYSNINGTYIST